MLAEILEPVAQHLAQNRRPLDVQESEIHRAGAGAGMIVTALWWAAALALLPDVQRQAAAMLGGRAPVSSAVLIAAAAWALFFISGVLLFSTGASRARGVRDVMIAAKAIVWIAMAAALLWERAFVADSPLVDIGLLTIYLWTLASGATRLYLALRGMPELRLPDPEDMGLPISGPASRDEAAEGMSGERDWQPPRFHD